MTDLMRRRETLIRGFILNSLQHGPCNVVALLKDGRERFDYTGGEIIEAGKRLGAIQHKLQGELYWTRPANLSAIWWGNRPAHYYERQQRSGGRPHDNQRGVRLAGARHSHLMSYQTIGA